MLLAIPMVLEMVLESLFAVVDVFWVGRLGADAMATVGITESLLSLVFAVGFGHWHLDDSHGCATNRRKRSDRSGSGRSASDCHRHSHFPGDWSALRVYAPRLLEIMGASQQIVAVGSGYARVALGGCGAVLLLFLNNAIAEAQVTQQWQCVCCGFSNILNLILDPCFIFGWGPFPKLGITGAATATLIGLEVTLGVAYQFYRLPHGTERIHILGFAIESQPWRFATGCCACLFERAFCRFAHCGRELGGTCAHCESQLLAPLLWQGTPLRFAS